MEVEVKTKLVEVVALVVLEVALAIAALGLHVKNSTHNALVDMLNYQF